MIIFMPGSGQVNEHTEIGAIRITAQYVISGRAKIQHAFLYGTCKKFQEEGARTGVAYKHIPAVHIQPTALQTSR